MGIIKEKKVAIIGNSQFALYRVMIVTIIVLSCGFSIIDEMSGIIDWPNEYKNVLPVVIQVFVAIVSLVISIIGIAISLQNEDFFGVKITKLYALREEKHYSILDIISGSIFLCLLTVFFYMLGLKIAVFGTLLGTLVFLGQIVCTEVPIMAKKEDAILGILKNNLIYCYLNGENLSTDLKDAIQYLLYKKNLKKIYEDFQDISDQNFNKYVMLELLKVQYDLAIEIKDKYDKSERNRIGSSLLENVCDILFRDIEMSDEMYSKIAESSYLLTGVFLCIYKLQSIRKNLLNKVNALYQYLSLATSKIEKEKHLISNVIVILVTNTVQDGDFRIIKSIRQRLADHTLYLTKASFALDVFAVISMYLYYLCYSEDEVPIEIKRDIQSFISEDNIIEERTKIKSWKRLFSRAAENFNVDYNRFISIAMRNSNLIEYYLFGTGAKYVVIQPSYLSQWFLTHLLNTHRRVLSDYSLVFDKCQGIRPHLINFCDMCMNEDKNFEPTKEMQQIVEFYNNKEEKFIFFRMDEENNHRFFNFVNDVKLQELKCKTAQASKVDNTRFAMKMRQEIETAIKAEWGFDSKMPIKKPARYFAVLFEKFSESVNFEECMIESAIRNVFLVLEKSIRKTVVYDDEFFESDIQKILSKELKHTAVNTKFSIFSFSNQNEKLKERLLTICEGLEKFESKLLGISTFVVAEGFSFNCMVENIEIRKLNENELAKQAEQYQRADGQFVFKGVFLSREEIEKIIEDKFAVLTVFIKHEINSSEDTVFELRPYSRSEE